MHYDSSRTRTTVFYYLFWTANQIKYLKKYLLHARITPVKYFFTVMFMWNRYIGLWRNVCIYKIPLKNTGSQEGYKNVDKKPNTLGEINIYTVLKYKYPTHFGVLCLHQGCISCIMCTQQSTKSSNRVYCIVETQSQERW
jgi:hypothetical protein